MDKYSNIKAYLLTKCNEMNQLYIMALDRAKIDYNHSGIYNSLLKALYMESYIDGMEAGIQMAQTINNREKEMSLR